MDTDWKKFNESIIEEFRSNAGRVGGSFEGAPMLLLLTTGARTGQERITPLVYTRDGESYVVIASKAGLPTNPAWYHNLRAHPDVTLEVGDEAFPARARVARGEERKRLFEQQAALMPVFHEYQAKTEREIPVIVLDRR